MKKEFTCILCPNSCDIEIEIDKNLEILDIEGAKCNRGLSYVKQELVMPMRSIATSVAIKNGELELASVKLDKNIPINMIFEVMDLVKLMVFEAPVYKGQIACKNILNTDCNLIFTKTVNII